MGVTNTIRAHSVFCVSRSICRKRKKNILSLVGWQMGRKASYLVLSLCKKRKTLVYTIRRFRVVIKVGSSTAAGGRWTLVLIPSYSGKKGGEETKS